MNRRTLVLPSAASTRPSKNSIRETEPCKNIATRLSTQPLQPFPTHSGVARNWVEGRTMNGCSDSIFISHRTFPIHDTDLASSEPYRIHNIHAAVEYEYGLFSVVHSRPPQIQSEVLNSPASEQTVAHNGSTDDGNKFFVPISNLAQTREEHCERHRIRIVPEAHLRPHSFGSLRP